MSAVRKTIQDNGVVESVFDGFDNLDEEERQLEKSFLDACLMAESGNKQTEQKMELTQTNRIEKEPGGGDSLKKIDQKVDAEQDLEIALQKKSQEIAFENGLSLKMEISCSPERLIEPNMDYTLDDVIEICSLSDDDDEDPAEDVVSTMLSEQKASAAIEVDENGSNKHISLNKDDNDNEELLTIFNDHTYTSQEVTTPPSDVNQDLRQNIINHIIKKQTTDGNNSGLGNCVDDAMSTKSNDSAIDESSKREIEEFVDQILKGKIEKFVGKGMRSNDSDKKNGVQVKTEFNSEAIHTEDFVQNIFYAVADEDAAEYAAEDSLANRKQKGAISETSTETCSFGSGSEQECEIPSNENRTEEAASKLELESNVSLSEFCSEPLEIISLEERFEQCATEMEEIEIRLEESSEQLEKVIERIEPSLGNSPENITQVEVSSKERLEESAQSEETTAALDMPMDEESELRENGLPDIETTAQENDENGSKDGSNLELRLEEVDLGSDFDRLLSVETASQLFKEFNALVKKMHEDCEEFSMAATNIDNRLGTYITEKLEIMRALVGRSGINNGVTECASQTEPELSRRRLKKLNKKDKRDLLASTDSSSRSSSSGSDNRSSSSSDEEFEKTNKKVRMPQRVPTTASVNEDKISVLNPGGVYDDGVVLTKYLRSDVFSAASSKITENNKTSGISTPTKSQSSTSSSSSSDDEGTSSPQATTNGDKDKKHKSNKRESLDDKDKEIERLINLDGLMKRHNNGGTSKQTDIDKHKIKAQNQKNKTDGMLEFLKNDMLKETLSSEESANENEEEAITEKQYLERYNQDLKNQLLNDSSNDTSQDEEADDEFAPALSDESDSGNRSPLVDKFLKTYNIEDSDEEMASDEAPVKDTSVTTSKADETKKPEDEVETKKEENQENNAPHSPENSDCELLNDSFIYRKRTQPKSLEKILSEAEKRKKIQKLDEDLISLSSESDCSDVEAVEIEPVESAKSRAIKPMLRPDQLQRETVKAQKSETERIRRLEKRQSMLAKVLTENPKLQTDEELVLDYNEDTKTFIKVHSDLVKHLKPHQRDGVRFMYDSCYGGIDSSKRNHGSGCILAHCMGLGKTLQLIALMHTVISYKELKTKKILVLCPKSTVMNWGDEILRWLFPLRTSNLKVYTFSDTSDINEKLSVMREWSQSSHQKAGCLLIGYEAFRTLVFYHKYKIRNNLDSTRLEKIRTLVDEYLLQPGADLVVCDEGHIIKNSKSAISLAVAEIKTPKRIVLTGTPIQNNLKEYYSMVNFIKPLFLGTEKEFANLYANPIKNGQHKDSNKRDIKVMKQRSFVLHKKLSKFVQRKEAELLKSFLPKKFEYVLFIPMTNVQNKLYERILETITSREDHRGRSLITDYTCLRKIWTHPKVLEDAWKNAINQQFKRDARKQANSDDDQPDDIYDSQTGFMSVKNDWWRNLTAEKDLESILPSNKLRTMFEILRMCEENGDKCLIFSAFVAVLNVVEYFFKKLAEGDKETLSELNMPQGARSMWEPNKDYFRLDGKTSKTTRHEMIKRFNHPNNTRARVFLISAKAGGQGINLIGANRVIILDTSWNPSNDQQNIFRIFRLGQKKNCYIYRLLAMGTMEEKVYSRSVTKQAMSFRVMDVQQIDRHYSMAELAELYTLTIPNYAERPTPIFPQDTILANLLRSFPDLAYKYHEHDSLLENKVEQELSEQEKIDAWNAYENDIQVNSQMANMEDIQSRMAQGNMPNYLGSGSAIPGLNLQALLNFRGMNTQANSSYMNPSLLQQYKQYNMANQQYLDIVNNYRQFSTPEAAAAFNATVAAYSSMNPSMYTGAAPSVSPHHTGSPNISANTASHPLNALNDLSMYGLGMNSGTSAAAAAAVAAATSLAQLPSTSSNANPPYATPGMPNQSVGTAGLYSNQASTFYQTLQQLGYPSPGNSNMLNNAALNSFTNSASFQAPRRTPPQTASRKSSTPDMSSYRNSGGSVSMTIPAPTSTMSMPAPTSTMSMPTTTMASMATKPNELPKSNSNLNSNPNSSNIEVANSGGRRNDVGVSRTTTNPKSLPNNSTMNAASIASTARAETTTTTSQNRQLTAPTSVATVTSTTKTSTTSKTTTSRTTTKQPASVTTTTTTTTKTADPQIRVKDMGQLCSNAIRSASLQNLAIPSARDMAVSTFNNINPNSNNNTVARNKQLSTADNRLMSATTSATAAELLKARSEMQIIPTTSPPGTASISKQLSEISPSISLTAVRNTNAKPSSTSSGNYGKVSGANSSTTNSGKANRVNSPATVTHSTLPNRQQTTTPILQQKKNLASANAMNVSNANPSTNAKKSSTLTVPTSAITSMPNLSSRKTVFPTPQSTPTLATVSSSSLNTNSNIGAKASTVGNVNNITNTTARYVATTPIRPNMATLTPATTPTTTTSGKTISSILRNHQIRKMPAPLPATLPSTGNIITSNNVSVTTYQPNSSINAKQVFVNNAKAGSATPSVAVANAGQALYNSKNNATIQRSSPITTAQPRLSRTVSPANATSTFIEKSMPNNSGVVGTGNKVNAASVPIPITSAATTTFPVHLHRSNSALGTARTLSPLPTVKAVSGSGLGNRTKSSAAIITPKITSVASLNNSTATTANPAATSSLSPAATAARVAAFKKLSNNGGKSNLQTAKQLQAAASSTLKAAAASSVVQQKRVNTTGSMGPTLQQQQQQQSQLQLSKQRSNIQSNGRATNFGIVAARIPAADQLSGVNVRPLYKGGTTPSNSASVLSSGDKRTAISSQATSASGQAAMAKLLLERKRKSSDLLGKDGGSLSKRPKES